MPLTVFEKPQIDLPRQFWNSTTSIEMTLSADRKTFLVWCCGSNESGNNNAVILVVNGQYIVLSKGSNITVTYSSSTLTVSSTTAIPMAIIEI